MSKDRLELFQLNEDLTGVFIKIIPIVFIRQGVKRQYFHLHLFLRYLSLLADVRLRLFLYSILLILTDNPIMEKCSFYCTQCMLPELIALIFAVLIGILGEHDVKCLNFLRFVPFRCAPEEGYSEAGNFCPVKQLFGKVAESFIGREK